MVSDRLALRAGGLNYPLQFARTTNVPLDMEYSLLYKSATFEDTSPTTMALASRILWNELLQSQSIYFSSEVKAKLQRLIAAAQAALAKEVMLSGVTAANDLECYVLLESLRQPLVQCSFGWRYPISC